MSASAPPRSTRRSAASPRRRWRTPRGKVARHESAGAGRTSCGVGVMSAGHDAERTRTHAQVDRVLRVMLPVAMLALTVLAWGAVVEWNQIPPYVLPGPRLVFDTLISDRAVLFSSLMV